MFRAVWQYRNFILAAVRGEINGRFARSRIGALWFILHPLAQAAILALVLSEVLAAKLPGTARPGDYAVYLLAGTAAWNLFAEVVSRCLNVFIEFSGALKKIAFPRLCLPLIVGGTALINHMFLLLATGVVCMLLGVRPSVTWLAVLPGAAALLLFAFGLGVLLGTLNVFARDIGQVVGVLLQLWFWMTPIVYPVTAVPDSLRDFLDFNPMVALVGIYQNAILLDRWPPWHTLVYPLLASGVLVTAAFVVFRRASPELVDAV